MKRGKKLTQEIQSLRTDGKTGKITVGTFLQVFPMLTQAGEPVKGNFDQDLFIMEMADIKTGEINKYWADGGVRGALKMAKVEPHTAIEIEHTGSKKIEEGTVQTYDIFQLEL